MGLAAARHISPELVLVCPELREHALRLLPALDPDELFEVEREPSPGTPERRAPERRAPERRAPERPRLALVEPQPRAPLPVALAAYATEALVLGALRGTLLIGAIAAVAFLLAQ